MWSFLAYAIPGGFGLVFSFMMAVFAATGGVGSLLMTGGLLLVAHIAAVVFVMKRANRGRGKAVAFVLVLPAFAVTALGWVVMLARAAWGLLPL
jgi:hypothetical protein